MIHIILQSFITNIEISSHFERALLFFSSVHSLRPSPLSTSTQPTVSSNLLHLDRMAREVIDSEGDCTIKCGDTEFLVSSKAVSLAAPQLSGDSIQRLASENPRTVQIFLNIAHHRSNDNLSEVDSDDMLSLADLIEKYGCRSAMMAHAQQWLLEDLEALSVEDLWKMLRFAHSMKIKESAIEICQQLVAHHSGALHSWAFAIDNLGSMPWEILRGCIYHQHSSLKIPLLISILAPGDLDELQQGLKLTTTEAVLSVATLLAECECQQAQMFIGSYIQSLGKLGILPGTVSFHSKTYSDVRDQAAQLPVARYPAHASGCCSTYTWLEQREHLLGELEDCLKQDLRGMLRLLG